MHEGKAFEAVSNLHLLFTRFSCQISSEFLTECVRMPRMRNDDLIILNFCRDRRRISVVSQANVDVKTRETSGMQ